MYNNSSKKKSSTSRLLYIISSDNRDSIVYIPYFNSKSNVFKISIEREIETRIEPFKNVILSFI